MTNLIILALLLINAALTFATYRKVSGSNASLRDIAEELANNPGSILKKL